MLDNVSAAALQMCIGINIFIHKEASMNGVSRWGRRLSIFSVKTGMAKNLKQSGESTSVFTGPGSVKVWRVVGVKW